MPFTIAWPVGQMRQERREEGK